MNTHELFSKPLTVKQAVLATLSYFDLFDVPLTRDQVLEYLLFERADEAKIDIYLKESPLITYQAGAYSLRGDARFWSGWREQKEIRSQLYEKTMRWRFLFELCPFVELVALCNSVPMGAVDENSDIDVFVVAKENRLFLARFFLTLLTSLFAVRRHGKMVRGRFCLSFYVTEEALSMKSIALESLDIYLAYWLRTLDPISGDQKIYERLLDANGDWMHFYFKNERAPRPVPQRISWAVSFKKALEWLFDRPSCEAWARKKQWSRMFRKFQSLPDKRGTVLSDTMLKFHDQDARSRVLWEWKRRLQEIL